MSMSNADEAETLVHAPPIEQQHAPVVETSTVDAPPEKPQVDVVIEEGSTNKPAKEKKLTTPRVKKPKALSHPPYFQMIKEAITALNEKGGSSPYAIAKYMEENHKPVLPPNFRKILGLQLKNSVTKGKLIKIKASFKLSEASKTNFNKSSTIKTRSARANAGTKPKETTKTKKLKFREVNKIENSSTLPSFLNVGAVTRGRRSKRSARPEKVKQLKFVKLPVAKKAKKAATAN